MDARFYLTQESYQKLITHLVNFEEHVDNIVNEYYPQPTQERLDVAELIGRYNHKLAEIVKNIITSEEADYTFPCVIIGSSVVIRDLASREIFYYTISGPYHNVFSSDDISYLSPVGRALLLRRAGDTVTVQTPSGKYDYEILSITFGKSKEPQESSLG